MGYECRLCGGNGIGFIRLEITSGGLLVILYLCPACVAKNQDERGEIKPTVNLLKRAEVLHEA